MKNKKKKKNQEIKKIRWIFITIVILITIGVLSLFLFTKPKITKIKLSDTLNENDTKTMTVYVSSINPFSTKCKINDGKWINAKFGKCKFDVKSGSYDIKVKNLNNETRKIEDIDVSGIKSFELEGEKTYLALNETMKLTKILDYVGNPDTSINWSSDNKDIVEVNDGKVTGKKVGEANITAITSDGKKDTIKVIVTDVIVPRKVDMNKKKITCHYYSEEEASLLDDILKTRIENKGLKTRAALIEAIRFMALSLEPKIPYFFENGRLEPYGRMHFVDGEGRYYHKGLYLSENKKEDIEASFAGPAIWGCPLTNYDTSYGWTWGAKYPNGLDCSGFITWALYNAGFDIGDIGSGVTEGQADVSDLGEMHELTYEFANSGDFKVGDIIARDGHTAMIAGMDEENIYIAESLLKGVVIETFSYKNKNSKLYKLYGYINTLDEFYESDGNYENMW